MVRAATLILMFVVGSTIGLTPSRRESGSTAQRTPASLELARNGITGYSIVLPEVPTPGEQSAAEELAAYLAQMSGAVFPLTRQSSGSVLAACGFADLTWRGP
jgi:hypothetical protein